MAVILLGGFPGTHPLGYAPLNYYDFTSTNFIWKDTARTSPVTADGDTIKGVTDQGSAANHLAEATNGPAWRTGPSPSFNSWPVAEFDGTNDILTSGSTENVMPTRSSACTMMAVVLMQTAAAEGGAPNVGKAYAYESSASQWGGSSTTVNPNLESFGGNSAAGFFARKSYTINTVAIHTGLIQQNGQADPGLTVTTWSGINDTRDASLATGTSGAGNFNHGAAANLIVGSASAAAFWDGYVAEIAIYTSILTEAQRQTIERYWAWKYNITLPY